MTEELFEDLWELVNYILTSGRYKESSSTQELLFTTLIDFAQSEAKLAWVTQLFLEQDCKMTDGKGNPVENLTVSTRQMHSMVKRIFSSKNVPLEKKQEAMAKLEAADNSDLLGRTKKFCEAALPTAENKRAIWARLFDGKEDVPMLQVWELCAGWKQLAHRDLIQEFDTVFFERIEQVVATKHISFSEAYYWYLQPNMLATDEEIARFSTFLERLQAVPEDEKKDCAFRLINWVKDSLQDLKEKKFARDLS